MLAEETTTEISKQQQPEGFAVKIKVARSGGEAAGEACRAVESRTGVPVIFSKNAAQLNEIAANIIETVVENNDV